MFYFNLYDDQIVHDVDGTDLSNLSEAVDHATGVAQELMFRSQGMLDHDWAQWKMSVRDSGGNELFSFRLAQSGSTDSSE
jgi:hypothetical protein